MLIAIGSDGKNLENKVAKRFGHAAYYIIYNTDDKSFKAMKNNDVDHTHAELSELLEKGVEVFIVGNIGPHAFELLIDGGAELYLARKMTVQEAIDKYGSGELEKLTESTVKQSFNHS
ncbi:MAG TPA: dinitrogenase iron-molybdenum cofactor biosynthesis protein [Ignavibacteria bacterium]|nr:dinitrogenase iron-molybdenum cofactor biosynthesis protein [Ignavibacteria bacterium]